MSLSLPSLTYDVTDTWLVFWFTLCMRNQAGSKSHHHLVICKFRLPLYRMKTTLFTQLQIFHAETRIESWTLKKSRLYQKTMCTQIYPFQISCNNVTISYLLHVWLGIIWMQVFNWTEEAEQQISAKESSHRDKSSCCPAEPDTLVPFAVCWWELNIFSAFWMAFRSNSIPGQKLRVYEHK